MMITLSHSRCTYTEQIPEPPTGNIFCHRQHPTPNANPAMKTETTMTATHCASEVSSYWKSVKLCLARPDGSAEIHHHDGRVERIGSDGWSLRTSKPGRTAKTTSVTGIVATVTPALQKEVTNMNDT